MNPIGIELHLISNLPNLEKKKLRIRKEEGVFFTIGFFEFSSIFLENCFLPPYEVPCHFLNLITPFGNFLQLIHTFIFIKNPRLLLFPNYTPFSPEFAKYQSHTRVSYPGTNESRVFVIFTPKGMIRGAAGLPRGRSPS